MDGKVVLLQVQQMASASRLRRVLPARSNSPNAWSQFPTRRESSGGDLLHNRQHLSAILPDRIVFRQRYPKTGWPDQRKPGSSGCPYQQRRYLPAVTKVYWGRIRDNLCRQLSGPVPAHPWAAGFAKEKCIGKILRKMQACAILSHQLWPGAARETLANQHRIDITARGDSELLLAQVKLWLENSSWRQPISRQKLNPIINCIKICVIIFSISIAC